MQKHLDEILQKRMDRKDFLKHIALGVAVMTGAAGVVKLLKPQEQQQGQGTAHSQVSAGYGASVYGGRPESVQKA